jgi:hypothetical protein
VELCWAVNPSTRSDCKCGRGGRPIHPAFQSFWKDGWQGASNGSKELKRTSRKELHCRRHEPGAGESRAKFRLRGPMGTYRCHQEKFNVAWQLFANRLNTLWGSLHAFLSYPLPISTVVTQTCGLVHGDPAMEFTERSDDMNSSISLTSYHERP